MVKCLRRWDSIQVRWSTAEHGISAGRVGDTRGNKEILYNWKDKEDMVTMWRYHMTQKKTKQKKRVRILVRKLRQIWIMTCFWLRSRRRISSGHGGAALNTWCPFFLCIGNLPVSRAWDFDVSCCPFAILLLWLPGEWEPCNVPVQDPSVCVCFPSDLLWGVIFINVTNC